MSPRSALAAAGVASLLFAALAVAVAAGLFSGVDQWAVEHLMPGADVRANTTSLVASLVPLVHERWGNGWADAANVVTVPGSLLVAFALVAWRSRPLAVALVAAVAVEVLCKEVLARPPLYTFVTDKTSHIVGLDSSFPSGHTLRTIIVAGAFWPLLRWWSVAWAAAAIALLLLAGWHTPTDLAGGVLVGGLGLLGGAALARHGAPGALRGRRLRRAARAG